MRVDVFFTAREAAPGDVAGRVVAVIDVLRASSCIAAALANGARAIFPGETTEAVLTRARAFDRGEVRLAGERRMRKIEGFDLGNSPLEFTRDAVEGRTVLMTTTNGTAAFGATQGAREVYVAAYVNFSPVAEVLRRALRAGADVAIVCAGQDGQFALEDAACAGRLVQHVTRRLAPVAMNDAALAAAQLHRKFGGDVWELFETSRHGQALAEAGFAADLVACATMDAYPVVPAYADRQITRLGPPVEA
ncbi:MAG: 2-phosphosulfolactate phosphatase [Gemmatimonadota bacterium]|nr:2-phosphosulfolactate phosphatase [Gemmatimonadota bacterium]MDE3126514.1 2-phosphosulfolactate phosphatase [Gemmatimonadota bacterium]